MIHRRNMCTERMYSNLKRQTKKSIPKLVFVLTKEHLNFYNYCAKTTTLMVKTLFEIKRMILKTLTSSKSQPKKLETSSSS